MTVNPVIDSAERLEALDTTRSFCVQAPAGSGKTELLTQRILKLLAQCEQPEEVLAFTFTRKAAAEMRSRLLQSLASADTLSPTQIAELPDHARLTYDLASQVLQQNQNRNWHLLENTQRLRITTIDAFNAYVTSQLPIISSFGSQPEISNDMEPIFQQAVQRTLSDLESDSQNSVHIAVLLKHLNNNLLTVQKLLCDLLYSRDQWLSHILAIAKDPNRARDILDENLAELIEENLCHAEELLLPYTTDICQLLQFAATNLANNGDKSLERCEFESCLPASSADSVFKWTTLANFFLTTTGTLRKTVTIKNGFPKPADGKDAQEKESFKAHKALFVDLRERLLENHEIMPLFILLQKLPTSTYSDKQWQVLSSLTALLPFLVAHLDIELKQQGKVDYVQVSSAALDALGTEDNPTDLAMRLDYQIKHILVDEFQDTSSLQSKLLEKLTWGWENNDGRTLFIVGDGMQSCYGFRNANVGLFLAARDNGIGDVKLNALQLKVNFRSQDKVVNWVNETFSQAFPPADDISRGAVSYSYSQSIHSGFLDSGVTASLLLSDKEEALTPREKKIAEAQAVIEQIQYLNSQHPESSIAILVRNRSHLDEIVPGLRHAGLAWNASGIDSLGSYPAIIDLLTLTKAMLNLADKTALLALLRTPFVGLCLKDIHQVAYQSILSETSIWQVLQHHNEISALSKDGQLRLHRVLPVLSQTRVTRQHRSLREWVQGCWIALGGPATLSPETDLAYIETFFQTLESESDNEDILDMHRFEEKLSSIYVTGKHKPDIKLQIMTIHNAKGLEFDYVLIPGLDRTPRANDNPLIFLKEHILNNGEEKLLLSLLPKKGQLEDPTYQYLKYEADLRNKMENTRLLYIAVTRAAKKAFLYGQLQRSKEVVMSPSSSSLLFTIWDQVKQSDNDLNIKYLELENLEQSQTNTSNVSQKNEIKRLNIDWVNPVYQENASIPVKLPLEQLSESPSNQAHHNLVEKKIGDIIHHCLKLKVEKSTDFLQANVLSQMALNWRNLLSPLCSSQQEVDSAISTIKENLENCLKYSNAQWLFDHGHNDSACELSLSDYTLSYRREFIIDRTFIDANNVRWIVDYKSSRPKSTQPLEEFLKEQVQTYRHQLENYAALFKNMEARPVKTALFFTAIAQWQELS